MRIFLTCSMLILSQPSGGQEAVAEPRVIAVVNGVPITSDKRPGRSGSDLAADYDDLSSSQQAQLLVSLINRQLVLEQARKTGFDQQEDIREAMEAVAETFLVEQYLRKIAAGFDLSDASVSAWYEAHYAHPPEQFLVSHILLASETEAQAALGELTSGREFEELARNRSMDSVSAQNGGRIGWLEQREMAPTFAEAVAPLDAGEVVSAPVKTQFGWHVVRLDERRDPPAPPLDTVRAEIRQALASQQMTDYMANLRSQAAIDIR